MDIVTVAMVSIEKYASLGYEVSAYYHQIIEDAVKSPHLHLYRSIYFCLCERFSFEVGVLDKKLGEINL